jgi:SAM-dependent methyltransferase
MGTSTNTSFESSSSSSNSNSKLSGVGPSFDSRGVLSRAEAKEVYDHFAMVGHAGGKDASSGYGGPAVKALIKMADFDNANNILDYGCGQGKLAEFVLSGILSKKIKDEAESFVDADPNSISDAASNEKIQIHWKGVDQSPKMIEKFTDRVINQFNTNKNNGECKSNEYCSVEFLESGDPSTLLLENGSIDRFISTYCLDLMSEGDMYKVLDKAAACLHPDNGLLLLVGITWGYKQSIKTFFMTAVWELLYIFRRKKVGGCRPQALIPYLKARGWRIQEVEHTMPNGFPWMVSEVISARPPIVNKGS